MIDLRGKETSLAYFRNNGMLSENTVRENDIKKMIPFLLSTT